MSDLIDRQGAIAYAISGRTREYDGEKWIRVSEVRESLQTMPSAQPERWIPVKERLPKINGQYLVTKTDHITNEHLIDIAFFADWYQNNNGFHKADRVIAWMCLPEPYTEEG